MFDSTKEMSDISQVQHNQSLTPIIADYSMTATDDYIEVEIQNGTDPVITLPSVASVPHGKEVAIYITRGSGSGSDDNLTIQDKHDDNKGGFTDIEIDKDKVLVVFKNIGQRHWILAAAKIAGAHMIEASLDFTE